MKTRQTALASLCVELLPVWVRHLQTSRDQSDSAVRDMLAAFGRVEQHVKPQLQASDAPGKALQGDVESMYVALQYQDRYSQMLQLLLEDMQRLLLMLKSPNAQAQDFDAVAWLAQLESRYAMAEQRRDHGGDGTAQPDDDQGTTFF